jgi:hypothetical protein
MKQVLFLLLASLLLVSTGCSAAGNDFDSVVSGVEHQYSVRAQRVPLMGLASVCAMIKTRGGVNHLRVAEFDNIPAIKGRDLDTLLRSRLGNEWQPIVREMAGGDRSGDQSVILVRPNGSSMGMFVADYDQGELDLVGMELNGAALARWLRNPEQQSSFHRRHSSTD